MRTVHVALAAALLAASLPPTAAASNSPRPTLTQITDEVRRARAEAEEITQLLEAKSPDFAKVNEKVRILARHAAALRSHVEAWEAANPVMTDSQTTEFQRLQVATEVLNIYVRNKAELLTRSDSRRDPSLLRAKAGEIVRHVGNVERTATRIGD